MNDKIKSLYDFLVDEGYEFMGSEDEFREKVQDTAKVNSLHDFLAEEGYEFMGTKEDFLSKLHGKKEEKKKQQEQRRDAHMGIYTAGSALPGSLNGTSGKREEKKAVQPRVDEGVSRQPVAEQLKAIGQKLEDWGKEEQMRATAGSVLPGSLVGTSGKKEEKKAVQPREDEGGSRQPEGGIFMSEEQRREAEKVEKMKEMFGLNKKNPVEAFRERLAGDAPTLGEEIQAKFDRLKEEGEERMRKEQEEKEKKAREEEIHKDIDLATEEMRQSDAAARQTWALAMEKAGEDKQSKQDKQVDRGGLLLQAINREAARLKETDIDRLMDEAWERIDDGLKERTIENVRKVLVEAYGMGRDVARTAAEQVVRGVSDRMMYEQAVEANMPRNVVVHVLNKLNGNTIGTLLEGVARAKAGTIGDLQARDEASQIYGKEHRVADIVGSVGAVGLDAGTMVAGGVGGAVGKQALKAGANKLVQGMAAGAANLATFEAMGEGANQVKYGGKVEIDEETGRYKVGGYDVGEILSAAGHGAALGTLTGGTGTLIGNAGGKISARVGSKAGKFGVKAGETATSIAAEGTIFALPEFMKGEGDFDTWLESVEMMAGFKAQGAMKAGVFAAGRARAKHDLKKADITAAYRLDGLDTQTDEQGNLMGTGKPRRWPSIKARIDAASNEEMKGVVESILDDKTMHPMEKEAVLNYVEKTMGVRGFSGETGWTGVSGGTGLTGYSGLTGGGEAEIFENRQENNAESSTIDFYDAAFERGHGADEQGRRDIALELAMADKSNRAERQAAWDGVRQRIEEEADEAATAEREAMIQQTHKDGTIRRVTLKEQGEDGKDKEGYVVDGKLVMTADGSMVDKEASDKTIVVYDPTTGERKMTDPSEVLTADAPVVFAAVEAEIASRREARVRAGLDAASGKVSVQAGQSIQLPDGRGVVVMSEPDEDGVFMVQTSDGAQMPVKIQDVQKAADDMAMADYMKRHPMEERQESDLKAAAPDNATSNNTTSDNTTSDVPTSENAKQVERPEGFVEGAPKEYVPGMELVIKDHDGQEKRAMVMSRGRMVNDGGQMRFEEDGTGNVIEYVVEGEDEPRHESLGTLDNVVGYIQKGSHEVEQGEGAQPKQGEGSQLENSEVEQPNQSEERDMEQGDLKAATPDNATPDNATSDNATSDNATSSNAAPDNATPTEESAEFVMPMREDGEPDFMATTPQQGHKYLYEKAWLSREEASQFVEANIEAAEKELKRVQGKAPKIGTSLTKYQQEKAKHQQQLDEAQRAVDYWQGVKAEQQRVVMEEARAKAERDAAAHEAAVAAEKKRQAEELAKQQEQAEAKEEGDVQVDAGEDAVQQGEKVVGRSLTKEEAEVVVGLMQQTAGIAPEVELTPDNWTALFGEDGVVSTPLGKVKMGENQYFKLAQQGRDGKLGMVKPTLEQPSIVIEDAREAKNGKSERGTSYIFIKTFTKSDGSRYYFFTSVTVSKEGKEVVISNQERGVNRITTLLQNGKVAWLDNEFSLHPKPQIEESVSLNGSNSTTTTDNRAALLGINPSEQSVNSESKGTKKNGTDQEKNVSVGERGGKSGVEREVYVVQVSPESGRMMYFVLRGTTTRQSNRKEFEEARAAGKRTTSDAEIADMKAEYEYQQLIKKFGGAVANNIDAAIAEAEARVAEADAANPNRERNGLYDMNLRDLKRMKELGEDKKRWKRISDAFMAHSDYAEGIGEEQAQAVKGEVAAENAEPTEGQALSLDTYVAGMTKLQRGRVEKVLNQRVDYREGGPMTRAEHVERLVANGAEFGKHVGNNGKVEYGIEEGDGSYTIISKMEYDYAAYLGGKLVPEKVFEDERERIFISNIMRKHDYPDIDKIKRLIERRERELRAFNPNTKEGKEMQQDLEDLRKLLAYKEKEESGEMQEQRADEEQARPEGRDAEQPSESDTEQPRESGEVSDMGGEKEEVERLWEDCVSKQMEFDKRWMAWINSRGGAPDYGDTREQAEEARNALYNALLRLSDEEFEQFRQRHGEEHKNLTRHVVENAAENREERRKVAAEYEAGLAAQGDIAATTTAKKKTVEQLGDTFTSRDKQHEQMNGVYHDEEGYGVATDAHVLVASKELYDKAHKGQIVASHKVKGVAEKGDVIEGRYPNWKAAVPSAEGANRVRVDWEQLVGFLSGVAAKMKAEKIKDAMVEVRMPDGSIHAYDPAYLLKFAEAARAIGVSEAEYTYENSALVGRSKDGVVMVMPMYNNINDGRSRYYYDLSGRGKVKEQKAGAEVAAVSGSEAELRDALVETMRGAGIEVSEDVETGQAVLDEVNGEARLMGSRVERRKQEIADALSGKEMSEEQQAVVDVFTGRSDNQSITVSREGKSYTVKMRQGSERGAGTKHSLFRHYGTGVGVITADDIIRIPDVLADGERIEKRRGKTRLNVYQLIGEDGTKYTILTEVSNRGYEVFNDFYTNKRASSAARLTVEDSTARRIGNTNGHTNTQLSAQADTNNAFSGAKLQQNSETTENNSQKVSYQRVYHGSGADFDAFDHSHMGEGEGAQAFGWGTYVTEVEGIGRTYAESMSKVLVDKYGEISENRRAYQRLVWDYEHTDDKAEKSRIKADMDRLSAEFNKLMDEYSELSRAERKVLYTVEIPDDNGRNYFDWSGEKVGEELAERMRKGVYERLIETDEEGVYPDERSRKALRDELAANINGDMMGEDVYNTLKVYLTDPKETSMFLHSLGFVGIKYPAEYRSGGRSDGAKNYVIFDEKDLQITDKVKFFKTGDGHAYGYTYRGKIYIDPRIATAETPIHEYTHLWGEALRRANPEAWERLKSLLLEDEELVDMVRKRYAGLEGDELMDEVFAHYSGRRGAERLRADQEQMLKENQEGLLGVAKITAMFNRLRDMLREYWNKARQLFAGNNKHLNEMSAEDFADMALGDLLHGVNPTAEIEKRRAEVRDSRQAENEGQMRLRFGRAGEVFYSNAERAVEGIRQGKATAEQWLAMIQKQGGLKAGEDKWVGLSDWLNERKGQSLTKDEVLDYIRKNAVQVEEVAYEDSNALCRELEEKAYEICEELNEKYRDELAEMEDFPDELDELESRIINEAEQRLEEEFGVSTPIRFRIKDVDGERIITHIQSYFIDDFAQKVWEKRSGKEGRPINSTRLEYTTEGLENKREIALTVPSAEPWNMDDEVHFGDAGEGRAVAWVRFGETRDADGRRVLVIDEIQSKRHQEGRENGYKSKELQRLIEARDKAWEELDDFDKALRNKRASEMSEDERRRYDQLTSAHNEAERAVSDWVREHGFSDIPEAPFEKNWHEVAMKRMLRYAAENGYDVVAWTKGEQQAERYGIGSLVEQIVHYDTGDGKQVSIRVKNGDRMNLIVDAEGRVVRGAGVGSSLSDVLGRELANKIMNGEGADATMYKNGEDIPAKRLEGDGLRIGGEGMKGFYDRMLPQFMDKYGKKWGVKTGEVELPDVEESGRRMWAVDVTEEMKRSVMEGQPMFHKVGEDGMAGRDVEAVNARFNEEVERYERGEMPEGHRFDLGRPSAYLKSAGFEDLPISMRASLLGRKAGDERHPFAVGDVKDLVKAIQKPIATFNYSRDDMRNLIVDVTHGGKHFLVGVTLNYQANGIEINSISGLFPKESHEWLKWIQDGKAIRIDQKEKVLDLIDSLRTNPAEAERIGLNLNSTAKIVKEFKNPEINLQDTDNLNGRNAKTEAIRERVEAMSERLGTQVRVVDDVESITHDDAKAQVRRRKSKGWYDPRTGEVVVVLPNAESVEDVSATVAHEVIGHKGLRELVGQERYGSFLDEVYGHLREELKSGIDEAAGRDFIDGLGSRSYEESRRRAVDELLARLAEKPFEEMNEGERTLWQKISDVVRKMLDTFLGTLKLPKWFKLGDNELRYMLWRSKENLERGREDYVDMARDVAKRSELGLTEEAREDGREESRYRSERTAEEREVERLTDEENGVLYHKAMEMQAEAMKRSGALPLEMGVFTANHFVVVNNVGEGNIKAVRAFDIEKQQQEIANAIKEVNRGYIAIGDSDGRRVLIEGFRHIYGDAAGDYLGREFEQDAGNRIGSMALRQQAERSGDNALDSGTHVEDDVLFREDETEDIWQDGSLGMAERITLAKVRLSAAHAEDMKLRDEARRTIAKNLMDLHRAMGAQREFDRSTTKRVADLARVLIGSGYMGEMSGGEVKRLLSAVKNATGAEDIGEHVQKVMDIMVDNVLKRSEHQLERMESVRGEKVNAKGVQVQGTLDAAGQTQMRAFKNWRKESLEVVEAEIDRAYEALGSEDEAISEEAGNRLVGLQWARQYADDIKGSKLEEKRLRQELEDYKAEYHSKGTHTKEEREAYRQAVAEMEAGIREERVKRAEAYGELMSRMRAGMRESVEKAQEWKESERERVREIHHNANSDLEGKPCDEHYEPDWKAKMMNSTVLQFLNAPLMTFEQMMRQFGSKSADGAGYLYNRYMRDWTDARQKEIVGYHEKLKTIDEKVAELFGESEDKVKAKSIGELMRKMSRLPKMKVGFMNGGEMKTKTLEQGNLMYIYMANKMSDGRMKLRKMGITEEAMQKIEEALDPRVRALADWVQEEFLPKSRNEYNETHKRLFGASMAAVEHYFPLKILKSGRHESAEELDATEESEGISTETGAIKKRVRNTLPLDVLGADALHVLLDHVAEMEHWNAFAEFSRDVNTLRTYTRFKNKVRNMTTIYGSGDLLWKKFNAVCQMATGSYRPPKAMLDTTAVNVAKGVTAAKVSLRLNTAAKQLLSAPAYASEVSVGAIAKSMATPWDSWNWCMENLPIFEERWTSRASGDPRLLKTKKDWKAWRSNTVQMASRIGMAPNAFVDALTVSIGAKAIYDTCYNRYIKEGYSAERAHAKAIQDAEIAYNLTQQSSEGAVTSTMQVDRSWLSVMLTVYRNSPMSYGRQMVNAARNLSRDVRDLKGDNYKERIEFMKKQYMRDGIEDEAQAEKNAKAKYRRQIRKDAIALAVYGFGLQLAWNIGGHAWALLFGDDDDDKDERWDDIWTHTAMGWTEGFTVGDIISQGGGYLLNEWLNDRDPNFEYLQKDMPLSSDIGMIVRELGSDRVAALNDVVGLAVQAGVGVNPETLTDVVAALMDACGDDPELTKEGLLFAMRVMQVPQSQIKSVYYDEVGLTGTEASKYTPQQLAERYAEYQVKRGRMLTPWAWDDAEALEKQTKREQRTVKERTERRLEKIANEKYARYEERAKEIKDEIIEANQMEDMEERAARYNEIRGYEDYEASRWFEPLDANLEEMAKRYLQSKSAEEARMNWEVMTRYKEKMVEVLDEQDAVKRQEKINALVQEYIDYILRYKREPTIREPKEMEKEKGKKVS